MVDQAMSELAGLTAVESTSLSGASSNGAQPARPSSRPLTEDALDSRSVLTIGNSRMYSALDGAGIGRNSIQHDGFRDAAAGTQHLLPIETELWHAAEEEETLFDLNMLWDLSEEAGPVNPFGWDAESMAELAVLEYMGRSSEVPWFGGHGSEQIDAEYLPRFLLCGPRDDSCRKLQSYILKSTQVSNDQECTICYQSLQTSAVALPCAEKGCQSVFHEDCILPWLLQNPSCPLCRCDAADWGPILSQSDSQPIEQNDLFDDFPLADNLSMLLVDLEEESQPWLRPEASPTHAYETAITGGFSLSSVPEQTAFVVAVETQGASTLMPDMLPEPVQEQSGQPFWIQQHSLAEPVQDYAASSASVSRTVEESAAQEAGNSTQTIVPPAIQIDASPDVSRVHADVVPSTEGRVGDSIWQPARQPRPREACPKAPRRRQNVAARALLGRGCD